MLEISCKSRSRRQKNITGSLKTPAISDGAGKDRTTHTLRCLLPRSRKRAWSRHLPGPGLFPVPLPLPFPFPA